MTEQNTAPTLPSVPGWDLEPAPAANATAAPAEPVQEAEVAAPAGDDAAEPKKAPERAPDGKFKAKDAPEEGEDGADEPDETEPDTDAPNEGKLPPGIVKRIAREKRKTERMTAERDEMDQRLDALRALLTEARDTKALREPEPGDFDTAAQFKAAHDRWDKLAKIIGAEKPQKAEARQFTPEFSEALADLKEVVTSSDADLWAEITTADIEISQHMVIALSETDDPAMSLRALKDDPAEAERISKLSPAKQMAAILALKPKPAAPTPAPDKRPAKVTQADDPPGEGARGRAVPPVDLAKVSFSEYEKVRSAQESNDRFGW